MEAFVSPDGVFKVEFNCFEMRMSHWVCNPRVHHVPSGEVLLDLFGSLDDGDASVDEQGRLHLEVRTYPGSSPGYRVVFDPGTGYVTTTRDGHSKTVEHGVLARWKQSR